MEKKNVVVMVINGIFHNEHKLIIQAPGTQYSKKFDSPITPEFMRGAIERQNLNISDCEIIVTERQWDKRLTIKEY